MLADRAIGLDVLVADLRRAGVSRGDARLARLVAHGLLHLIERPAEIDGGRARRGELLAGVIEPLVGGIGAERERNAVSRGRADQRRAAHLHRLDRMGGIVERAQAQRLERDAAAWSGR